MVLDKYKLLKGVLDLYDCLGIENSDRNYIDSLIRRLNDLQKNLPNRVTDYDLISLEQIIHHYDLTTPIQEFNTYPEDLTKIFEVNDVSRGRIENILVKENGLEEYNRIVKLNSEKRLNFDHHLRTPPRNWRKRATYLAERDERDYRPGSTQFRYPDGQPYPNVTSDSCICNEDRNFIKEILTKYRNTNKQKLNADVWIQMGKNQTKLEHQKVCTERDKIKYITDIDENIKLREILLKKNGVEEYNKLINNQNN